MAKRGRPFGVYGHYKKRFTGPIAQGLSASPTNMKMPNGVFNGMIMEQPKLPIGEAERGGLFFDSAFGLGNLNAPDEFKSKIGVNLQFGQNDYDVGFTKSFIRGEFQSNQPHLISNNYSEPNENTYGSSIDVQNFFSGKPQVSNVVEASRQLTLGRRIPLTDQEADEKMRKIRRREITKGSGLSDLRVKQIEAGSNFLSNEEQRLFEAGYTIENERYDTRRRSLVGNGM